MAWAQKAIARGVWVAVRPTFALNHWRSASIKLIAAIGVRQIWEANETSSSKSRSGGLSRIAERPSASSRSSSPAGAGAIIQRPPDEQSVPAHAGTSYDQIVV